ncbi:tRNA A37 threonylcarbamoyladenosine synthetase subunit TsaC/SUA5/YrdC [Halalkaliarchaeum sp. AArc-CO]|uniref:L-threonylcarbamoyladenylate synthase n=1 Tax=unclassified Halalkaliarchaeum TaxID=2678344 RepID=UPI00217DF50C|nr:MULTISPECIES: L-threonylcarbamoyladenylate synthase [unclassified Halalkaliarchaeum]MDR5672686.1 L-threonylcarbamoyladenylate synthase [Halalkaliarchaeum sp. AArc-GB]UWG49409.1 tRNA A37 threonylcarbamoyladenosine synthetase subunit TsaC/SUA5/YrdC [Halalkaliarchaeum sp. AArc-CO]
MDDTHLEEGTVAAVRGAAGAVAAGGTVVYPTETVYGLGTNALDPAAVERVFEIKRRPRSEPLSLAVPTVDDASAVAEVDDRTARFMRRFLPGPVTVVVPRTAAVPDVLTAGLSRVGIRVPDHAVALALLRKTPPLTATSANLSGAGSARRIEEIDPDVREAVDAIIDGGKTPGGASTVVDPGRNEIIRRGLLADEIEAWLDGN